MRFSIFSYTSSVIENASAMHGEHVGDEATCSVIVTNVDLHLAYSSWQFAHFLWLKNNLCHLCKPSAHDILLSRQRRSTGMEQLGDVVRSIEFKSLTQCGTIDLLSSAHRLLFP